jgi:DNA-binding Lrp family transcriptional regulator
MQESAAPNEFDLSLVNALQLVPRATWTELSPILEADPTTLARRWKRLQENGLARVTAFPRPAVMARLNMAYVELSCRNGTVEEVASVLAEHPDTLTIQFIAGSHQLLLTVVPGAGLADYLLNWVGGFPDVISYHVHVVTGMPYEAQHWQVGALSPAQRRRLRALVPPVVPRPGSDHITELDQRVIDLLCDDGRVGYHDIAERLGIAPATAARRLNRLLREGILGLRCDIAREAMGWPVAAVLWGSAGADVLERAGDLGERIPEVRLCSTLAGPENTHLVVWLRTAADLVRVERRLLDEMPGLRIADRRVILRTFKFMGGIVDARQRYSRTVPLRPRAMQRV